MARSPLGAGCTAVPSRTLFPLHFEGDRMKPILLWLIGIPIPIILLLWFFVL